MIDPVALTAALIRCPSVTPEEGGALQYLGSLLREQGFEIHRADRNLVSNLIAIWRGDEARPCLGFNGHTDVVPVGDPEDWKYEPFAAHQEEGRLYGRGACDMKSGVAAFVAAACDHVKSGASRGSLVITITGDEEGDAADGTRAILDYMHAHSIKMDHCIVGEPTCPKIMGEMIKIGRRGSMNVTIVAEGKQGHAAYPHRAKNPLPALVRYLNRLDTTILDQGSAHFDPSTLTITTVDVGNSASNVIPAKARAAVNIRFNDLYSGASLSNWLKEQAEQITQETGIRLDLSFKISGESFLTQPDAFSETVAGSVQKITEKRPEFSTSGGTSDARFIKDICPVIECGLVGTSMHQVDEFAEVEHIYQLKDIYAEIINRYFKAF